MANKKITDLDAATPTNKKISVQNFFKLPTGTVAEVNAYTNKAAGQLVYVTDGNAGSACLAVYDGSNWKVVALGATIATS
jgi:hypothetical protein